MKTLSKLLIKSRDFLKERLAALGKKHPPENHADMSELHLQQVYFQQLFENSPEAIAILDNSGRVIKINCAFTKLFGYTAEEIKDKSLHESIVPVYLLDQAKQYYQEVFQGRSLQLEGVRKNKNGRIIHVSILGYPVFQQDIQVGIFAIYSDITERKEAENKLKYLSLHDFLTGLYNRTFFEQQMRYYEQNMADQLGIMICDIDGLKLVNDTLGHESGDVLLLAASEVICSCLTATHAGNHIVARIGGDEFAIILPDISSQHLETLGRNIHLAVEAHNSGLDKLPLNISTGWAHGVKTTQIHELFREADNNMYREKLLHSCNTRSSILQTLMKSLETRDFIARGHGVRIENLVVRIARQLQLPDRSVQHLILLAHYHDIGKVGVPDQILFKEGPLTDKESKEMKRHSEIGYRIAQASINLHAISDLILKHHEWWDGSGYPLNLCKEDIPLECRILALADSYDSMTHWRPYRKELTGEQALAIIRKGAGKQFDPKLAEIFLGLFK